MSVLIVLLLIALYHMALGLQVAIEDYVHVEHAKVPTVAPVRLVSFTSADEACAAELPSCVG